MARFQKCFLSSGIVRNAASIPFGVIAPYSINSLLKVETQHLRLMYPRRSRLVSSWLVQHAHAATSEYDSNPTSWRQISRGSLAGRQGKVATSLLLPSWPLSSFPSYLPSAGRAALLSLGRWAGGAALPDRNSFQLSESMAACVCWLQKGRCSPRLSPQQSHARCGALASISSTRIRYYHKKQVQIFITQRLYDSQQRLLKNYFFPGRVERRVRFGLEECIPSVPAFPFFTEE